ncbi:hypothetical protein NP493_67g03023 [Ridgeia piscesae]|uniref:Uncharacterized protein n=1 Tax=Ridgeia piscesae TaxID=27915 RepID=A0AAD9P9P2_RIDPI|nr:hypothetical protein NP493_67g03023 [Ridgeia piscesae]
MKRLFQCVSRRHSGGSRLMDHYADPISDQDLVDDNNNTVLALNLDQVRRMDQADGAPLILTVPLVGDDRGTNAAQGVVVTTDCTQMVVTADCTQMDVTGSDGDGDITLTGTGDREDTANLKNPRHVVSLEPLCHSPVTAPAPGDEAGTGSDGDTESKGDGSREAGVGGLSEAGGDGGTQVKGDGRTEAVGDADTKLVDEPSAERYGCNEAGRDVVTEVSGYVVVDAVVNAGTEAGGVTGIEADIKNSTKAGGNQDTKARSNEDIGAGGNKDIETECNKGTKEGCSEGAKAGGNDGTKARGGERTKARGDKGTEAGLSASTKAGGDAGTEAGISASRGAGGDVGTEAGGDDGTDAIIAGRGLGGHESAGVGRCESSVSAYSDRDYGYERQEILLQEELTRISHQIRLSSLQLNGAFKRQRERDALLKKEQRRLSILQRELQQTQQRIERTDRHIEAVRAEQRDVRTEIASTSSREVALIKQQLSDLLPRVQQHFDRFTQLGVDGLLEDIYRDIKVSEDLVVRLQYITRRRHKKRDPAVKESGSESHSRRLFFSSSSPVASHHRKLVRLKKDADTANGSGARAHALPSGRQSSGEPHVMGSLQLPVAPRLERHDCSFVETQL